MNSDRQTVRKTDLQTDRQKVRQTMMYQKCKTLTDKSKSHKGAKFMNSDRQTYSQTDRLKKRHNRQTVRQTDRNRD